VKHTDKMNTPELSATLNNQAASPIQYRRAIALKLATEAGAELGLTLEEVLEPRRFKSQVEARRRAYAAARALGWSYPEIGRAFNKDHTTILNALQKAERKP
jgi:chromosomal replication initiation ATPase DnaA